MNEFNQNPESQDENKVPNQQPQAFQEPRTPYQTPVQQPQQQQPNYQQNDQGYQQNTQQSYQGYQPPHQTNFYQAPPYATPKKKKNHGNGLVIGICSVAAACLLFGAGVAVSNVITGQVPSAAASSAATSGGTGNSNSSPSTPTMAIVSSDSYDLGDGLAGEEIYKKVNPSIVSIISSTISTGTAYGSGIIMTEDGYIITNNHVVEGADQVSIQLYDGTQLPAKVIGLDSKTDLAVLKVSPTSALTAAEFGDSDALEPGEYAYAIGSPGGIELANSITGGRISAINRDITIDDRVMTLIQTDASINPGNSGGALINKYGQVVGVTSAKLGISYYEGLGFAIPINTAKTIVDELIANGYVMGRPSIGITGYNVSEQTAQYNNVPQGVYVVSVDERASAGGQGLQAKDIITAVNGKTITTMDEINAIKEEMQAGDTLKVSVYRMSEGKSLDLTITLMDEHDLSNETATQENSSSQSGNGYSQYGNGYTDPFSYFFGN